MLKILRKKGVAKKLLWGIAIVIIISFGFFGSANYLDNPVQSNNAGKIFGKTITLDKYERALQSTTIQAYLRYGENFNQIRSFLNLESEAWDRLMLLHEADKAGITVSDEEVIENIDKLTFFQRDGQFDSLLYNDVLRFVFRMEPRAFEETVRDSLKLDKLFAQKTDWVTLTDDEVYEEYFSRNEKIRISYITFLSENFKSAGQVSKEDAMAYYENHKTEFTMPESIKVDYLVIPLADDTSEGQRAEIEARVKEINAELKVVFDLAAAAKKYSLKMQTTGFFNREQPDPTLSWPFEVTIRSFELKKDQISDPVETARGFYFLQLKEKQAPRTMNFDEARSKIEDNLLMQTAQAVAGKEAEKGLVLLKEKMTELDGNFSAAGKALGWNVVQTQDFGRGEYLPQIGISKDFQDRAFSLTEENPMSGVVQIQKGYAILHLDSKVPVDQEQFQTEKEGFSQNLLTERKNQALSEYIAKVRLKADLQDNISQLKGQTRTSPPNR